MAASNIEITWVNRGHVIAHVDGQAIRIGGEVLLARDPDFMIYARSVTAWGDGTPLSREERAERLDQVIGEAARRGWKFEISWAELASGALRSLPIIDEGFAEDQTGPGPGPARLIRPPAGPAGRRGTGGRG